MAKDIKLNTDSCHESLIESADAEAKQNLLGFFNLLLEIDKRNNPQDYEKDEDRRNTNNNV